VLTLSTSLLLTIALAVLGHVLATRRALSVSGGDIRALAALPKQYALNTVMSVLVPAAAVLLGGLFAGRFAGEAQTIASLLPWFILAAGFIGFAVSLFKISPEYRARTHAESWIKLLLILASGVAIMTTVGIVFSMLFEASNFFSQYSWRDFFFSTEWSPNFRGNSALGILPLLWGTLYISFIALAGLLRRTYGLWTKCVVCHDGWPCDGHHVDPLCVIIVRRHY